MADLIFETRDISEVTKKTYRNAYQKLLWWAGRAGDFDYISSTDQRSILSVIKGKTTLDNKHSIRQVCMVVCLIKKMLNQPFELVEEKRNEVARDYRENAPAENKRKRDDVYPTQRELEEWIENLENPISYVMNKMMYKYGLRNRDVNLTLYGLEDTEITPNDNFLQLLPENKVRAHIENYKTSKTYGPKTFVVEDEPKLYDCLNTLITLKKMKFLFPKLQPSQKGIKGPDNSLFYKIKKFLYPGLTESDYLKIRITTFIEAGKGLVELSKTRGTSVETMIGVYG